MNPSSWKARHAGGVSLLTALSTCAPPAADGARVPERLVTFDFEDVAWVGRGTRTDSNTHAGSWSGVLANSGHRKASAWSPLIEVGDASWFEFDGWIDSREINGGELTLALHSYAPTTPEHPALPPEPSLVGTGILLRLTEGRDWTWYRKAFVASVLGEGARFVRLELRLEMDFRAMGTIVYDDFTVKALHRRP